ncbi:MAG: TetR/AcrR family transcriptional regulator [Actinomycetota bacterium]
MGRNAEANEQQREETRRRLLDAGLTCFAQGGLGATSVQRIATEAGLSKGLLYHYFPSKRALAEAIIEDWTTTVATAGAEAPSDGDPPAQRLAATLRAIAGIVEARPAQYRMYLLALGDPAFREIAGDMTGDAPHTHPWAPILEAAASDAPGVDAELLQASLIGIFAHHVLSPRPTAVTPLVDRLLHHLLEEPWTPS